MSDAQEIETGFERIERQVREWPLSERLTESCTRIGKMCSEGRPPMMSVPVRPTDDDFYITTTLRDAQSALADRDRRIEALTKALRGMSGCTKEVANALNACAMFSISDNVARNIALKMVKEAREAVDTANALLSPAAGADGGR